MAKLVALPQERSEERRRLLVLAFAAISWPWLLRSLWGGRQRDKRRLLERLELPASALPHLGSWKADAVFLNRLVDCVEETRPAQVVELGCGVSTLILAAALRRCGHGRLISYDHDAAFLATSRTALAEHGLEAVCHHAPLRAAKHGQWYDLVDLPKRIDLLVIDGPPWTVHPFGRGAAQCLFPRLADGGRVVLDDAARPGERIIARRWRRAWPGFEWRYERGIKGILIGVRRSD